MITTLNDEAYLLDVIKVMWPKAQGCSLSALQPIYANILTLDHQGAGVMAPESHVNMLIDFLAAHPAWRPDV